MLNDRRPDKLVGYLSYLFSWSLVCLLVGLWLGFGLWLFRLLCFWLLCWAVKLLGLRMALEEALPLATCIVFTRRTPAWASCPKMREASPSVTTRPCGENKWPSTDVRSLSTWYLTPWALLRDWLMSGSGPAMYTYAFPGMTHEDVLCYCEKSCSFSESLCK